MFADVVEEERLGKSVYCLDEWGQPHGDVTALQVDEIGQLTKLTTVSTGTLAFRPLFDYFR